MVWVAVGLTLETALFSLAGAAWLRTRGYTLAEAAAGGTMILFIALSLVHQLGFLLDWPLLGGILELIGLGAVGWMMVRRRYHRVRWLAPAIELVRRERLAPALLGAGWAAMTLFLVWGWFTGPLPSGLILGGEWQGLWSAGDTPSFSGVDPLPPLNGLALFHHTTRFGLGPAACGFGLLAYMAIGFSTYAMARRHAWPAMALTIALMVSSMPRLVALGVHPTPELITTTAVVFCLVLIHRLVEQYQPGDWRFFLLCLLFSISTHPMNLALVPILALLLMVLLVRRHGWLVVKELAVAQPGLTAVVLTVALVLAQLPVFALNLAHGHPLLGRAIAFDNDGILGAAANLIRYLFASVDPTEPLRQLVLWLVEVDLYRLTAGIYTRLVVPLVGQAGAAQPFAPLFSGAGQMVFGPLVPLLVLPAMVHALARGTRRLKALSVAWMGYLYLASLVMAWGPACLAVLTPVYAANGFAVAFFLPPWRVRRRGMRLIQGICALLLAGSLAGVGRGWG